MRLLTSMILAMAAAPPTTVATTLPSGACADAAAKAEHDALAFYPAAAMAAHLDGLATITCRITTTGAAKSCQLDAERPLAQGFGDAALAMAASTANAAIVHTSSEIAAGTKTFAIEFKASPPTIRPNLIAMKARVEHPHWARLPDVDDLAFVMQKARVREGVAGRATLACIVTDDGRMSECSVLSESPVDSGFGKAGLFLMAYFKMAPLTESGCPVGGAKITIPVLFGPLG